MYTMAVLIRDHIPPSLKDIARPFYSSVRRYWLYRKPPPVDVIQAYWRSPDAANDPREYLKPRARSRFLVDLLHKYVPTSGTLLELGCNVGRNLNEAYEAGYLHLEGVDINPEAITLLKQSYPETARASTLHVSRIEDYILSCGVKDCIFTMAVLVHIHPASDWIFAEIAKRAKTLIVIEGEYGATSRHFARNYKTIFERLGLRQVEEVRCADVPELAGQDLEHYTARVFQH